MNRRGSLALGAALVALAASSLGCSSTSTCSRAEDEIDVIGYVNADRTMFSSIDPAQLETADGGKPTTEDLPSFAYFPANRSIRFHIGLVDYPTQINPYLAFSHEGDRTVAPCAGNLCLIRTRNKNEIVLRNDTCSEFWVWLTASTSSTPFQPVSDAGVDDGQGGASGADASDAGGAADAP